MHTNNAHAHPISQHPFDESVLSTELRSDLLSLSCSGKKAQQLRKAIQQGMNKAPDTLATLLVSAKANPTRLAVTILSFFRAQGTARSLRELMPEETKLEGELNCVEMRVAQGDLSVPTLKTLETDLFVYSNVIEEMKVAVSKALHGEAK